jgi:hypothetical protein
MESIESDFVDEKEKEEDREQPMRAGRLAQAAMATLFLLGGAVDRMSAQTHETGAEKNGNKQEEVLKESKAEFPASFAAEKEATEKIFDECRSLRGAMDDEVKNVEKVFADKNATSMQMLEALSKLQGPYHKLEMTALKAQGVLSDVEMKELDKFESLSSGERRTFSGWSKKLFGEWKATEGELRKVGSVIGSREAEILKKNHDEFEKMKKDIDKMLDAPPAPLPTMGKKIEA